MDLKLVTFNNYFNRRLKKKGEQKNIHIIKNVSFNPADDITTTQIVNTYNNKCDYAILTSISLTEVVVWAQNVAQNNLNLIKYIKNVTGLSLTEAKSYGQYLKNNYPEMCVVDYPVKEAMEAVGLKGYNWTVSDPTTKLKEINIGSDISHWFILEANRLRTGQYQLTLKRDVLVDYYNSVVKSPIFVNKGYLKQTDPMICNDEGMLLNKIKIGEHLLKDKTNTAWIVGYCTKKELVEDTKPLTEIKVQYGSTTLDSITPEQIASQLEVDVSVINEILSNKAFYGSSDEAEINYGFTTPYPDVNIKHLNRVSVYLDTNFKAKNIRFENPFAWADPVLHMNEALKGAEAWEDYARKVLVVWKNSDISTLVTNSRSHNVLSTEKTQKLINILNQNNINYNNTILKINPLLSTSQRKDAKLSASDSDLNQVLTNIAALSNPISDVLTNGNIYIWLTENNYQLDFEIVTTENTYKIPFASASNRRDCSGSVSDIFAIPFGSCSLTYDDGEITDVDTISDKELLLKIASTIATTLDKQLYDLQLLPYCPLTKRPLLTPRNSLALDGLEVGKDFDWIIDGKNEKKSIIYWLSSNQLTFDINVNLTVNNRKIESNTDLLRISSPNGQGNFDMNVAKNDGLDYVTVNMTYKPYQPYIQILPNFKSLYGSNYNDYRGLICNGDFSLARITDEWIQYQLNNKNYQNIFNREIYNLDLSNRQAELNSAASMFAGTIATGVQGAVAGSLAGPYGAVAGAAAGLVGGAVGGALDYQMAEQVRKNNRDYTVDRFNYSLGNIKALPNSITKIDSFVVNSKLFPFFEIYSCTAEEKEALISKIKYDGMTVNRIGYLLDFTTNEETFFKGQLIRLEDVEADTHIVNGIYDELLKGVYLDGNTEGD